MLILIIFLLTEEVNQLWKMFFSQGIKIHNSNIVNISNSEIINSNRDDGVNIKNSFAMLFNNKFYNNKFDALDLDFVNGYVINNIFKMIIKKHIN